MDPTCTAIIEALEAGCEVTIRSHTLGSPPEAMHVRVAHQHAGELVASARVVTPTELQHHLAREVLALTISELVDQVEREVVRRG